MKTSKAGRSGGTSNDMTGEEVSGRTNKFITHSPKKGTIYVELNVQKESTQLATVDRKMNLPFNKKMPSGFESITVSLGATIANTVDIPTF